MKKVVSDKLADKLDPEYDVPELKQLQSLANIALTHAQRETQLRERVLKICALCC